MVLINTIFSGAFICFQLLTEGSAFSSIRIPSTTPIKSRKPLIGRRYVYSNQNGIGENDSNSEDDGFLTSLQSRMTQLKRKEVTLPLIRMDCILPRQVLRVRIQDPQIISVIQHVWREESPTFGMHGTTTTMQGETMDLIQGVQVEVMERPKFIENGGVLLILKGQRRFQVLSESLNEDTGLREAHVTFLDSREQEIEEMEQEANKRTKENLILRGLTTGTAIVQPEQDTICIAKAIIKASELTGLIERWITLARPYEKRLGQIDILLDDLGPVPPAYEPSERAFWVGALINPLPEMGVAKGVRPELLMATTAQDRVDVAYDGILESIRHMNGSAPLW